MNMLEQTIQVTLQLPTEIYNRVADAAGHEQRGLEDLLGKLVIEGLDAHLTLRELFERLSHQYCTRLVREHKLDQSPTEVLHDLRNLREQIAHELYS